MVENQFCGQSASVRFLAVTFKYTFRIENEGTTVPYPAIKDVSVTIAALSTFAADPSSQTKSRQRVSTSNFSVNADS